MRKVYLFSVMNFNVPGNLYVVTTGQRRVDPCAVRCLIDRIKGQRAKTGISEAGQRRKQYQAEVGVTGTGSEFQGRAVRGQTQR